MVHGRAIGAEFVRVRMRPNFIFLLIREQKSIFYAQMRKIRAGL